MSSFRALVFVALSSLSAGSALAEPPPKPKPKPSPDEAPGGPSECAKVSASARNQGIGYSHIVTLENSCKYAVTCEVWTDVDPEPRHTLRAAAGETQEVVTRRGSPATAVAAQSVCRKE